MAPLAVIPGITASAGFPGFAIMPSFAGTLATGAAVGGIGLQALGTYQAGQAAAAQAESQAAMAGYNAKLAEREAETERARTGFAQRRHAEEASRYLSSLRAQLGASGAVPSAGTPLLIQSRQAAESELENMLIGYEGELRAQRAISQAALDRAQADVYRTRARYGRQAGYFGAGSTLLTGFGGLGMGAYGY